MASATTGDALREELWPQIQGIAPTVQAGTKWTYAPDEVIEGADPRTFDIDVRPLGRKVGGWSGAGCTSRELEFIVRTSYAGMSPKEAEALVVEDMAQLERIFWPTPTINILPFEDAVVLDAVGEDDGHLVVEYTARVHYLRAD